MERLFSSLFTTHNAVWGDIQTVLYTFLTSEEARMVLEKAEQVTHRLHEAIPNNLVKVEAVLAVPMADPGWNSNDSGDRNKLDHYEDLTLLG